MDKNLSALDIPSRKVQELKLLGYNNCEDVNKSLLREDSGLLLKFETEHWNALNKNPVTKTALQIFNEESEKSILKSISSELDSFLGEEILPGRIIELCGDAGCGKTQLCYLLSVATVAEHLKKQECLFISTNQNFASHRLREITEIFISKYNNAEKLLINVDLLMDKIYLLKASVPIELLASTITIKKLLKEKNIGLLIIDSISYIIRQVDSLERSSFIYKILRRFKNLADSHNFAIVVTNDLTTKTNGQDVVTAPAFGESFYHAVNTRILLSKVGSGVFNAKLLKSPVNSVKEVTFQV